LGAGLGILDKEVGVSPGSILPNIWPFNIGSGKPAGSSTTAVPTFKVAGAKVTLSYQPRGSHTVTIGGGPDGRTLKTISLENGQPIESALLNDTASAELFTIQQDGSADKELVSVPGTMRNNQIAKGDGTLGQFACAVSDAYGIPVLVESKKAQQPIQWTIDPKTNDAQKAATGNLSSLHLSIGVRVDGLLTIQDR
jgi:hypothetical protein